MFLFIAVASLISYPNMLPEFEKTIPKPLKKRYRDFFNADHENPVVSNLENVRELTKLKLIMYELYPLCGDYAKKMIPFIGSFNYLPKSLGMAYGSFASSGSFPVTTYCCNRRTDSSSI